MGGHSSRLEKAEEKISQLEDEMEELLVKSRPVRGICRNSPTPSKDQP
jgi:GMP synthase-like glutamine amidotransferase